mgnify:CR=1 FL=1
MERYLSFEMKWILAIHIGAMKPKVPHVFYLRVAYH